MFTEFDNWHSHKKILPLGRQFLCLTMQNSVFQFPSFSTANIFESKYVAIVIGSLLQYYDWKTDNISDSLFQLHRYVNRITMMNEKVQMNICIFFYKLKNLYCMSLSCFNTSNSSSVYTRTTLYYILNPLFFCPHKKAQK